MASYDALYYPYIHFQDDSWLKACVLYWDSMARIVPQDYPLRDSETVRVLKDELGFIVDENPTDRDAKGAASEFLPALTKNAKKIARDFTVKNYEEKTGGELGYIYHQKLNGDAIQYLKKYGLSRSTRFGDPLWVGMHPDVAGYYMTLLADTMAFRSHRVPVTSDALGQSAAGASIQQLLAKLTRSDILEDAVATNRALNLVIELVVPRGLARIPAPVIVKFVQKYKDEKQEFQQHLDKLIATAKDSVRQQDPKAFAQEMTRLYDRTVKRDMIDLKKRLRDMRWDAAKSVFRNQVKLWGLGATWGVISPEPTPVSTNRLALMGSLPLLRLGMTSISHVTALRKREAGVLESHSYSAPNVL